RRRAELRERTAFGSEARRLSPQGRAPRANHLAGARSRSRDRAARSAAARRCGSLRAAFLRNERRIGRFLAHGDERPRCPAAGDGSHARREGRRPLQAPVSGERLMLPARTQRGIALVTAVMIVAIATAIAVQIAFAHQIWFRQMENVADRDATDWLRRGALHWASLALLEDAAQNSTDHLGESWAMGLPTLPVEGGTIKVSIEDAQGRFNLNSVVNPANLQVLSRLLQVLRLDPQLANAVLDWIVTNSDALPGGAEDVYYLNLNPPYPAANRPILSV